MTANVAGNRFRRKSTWTPNHLMHAERKSFVVEALSSLGDNFENFMIDVLLKKMEYAPRNPVQRED